MEDIKIDLKELKGLYEKSKEPRVTKHPFFPVIHYLFALRMLGIRHTDIAIWLNARYKTKISNNQLSDLLGRWRKQGLYNEEKAKTLALQIQNTRLEESSLLETARQHDNINVFSNRLPEFLTAISKNRGSSIPGEETQALKNFFNEFGNKYALEEW
ncbi:hypothetical protein [Burkholderia cenocepacia]|uniref:hypothetical protein n=1 Tax=Burkholderia cenocepacia TaxID=95486 RepID=UPI001B955A90|nr:hypothetical protein [Burkholderia cenocepacia]MBR8480058.1 hypothetical protein [Burkholderia cenocepacia]